MLGWLLAHRISFQPSHHPIDSVSCPLSADSIAEGKPFGNTTVEEESGPGYLILKPKL